MSTEAYESRTDDGEDAKNIDPELSYEGPDEDFQEPEPEPNQSSS